MTTKIKLRGEYQSRNVFLNDEILLAYESLKLRNHSPDGFNWGYGGSGPSQLALAILMELTDADTSLENYQQFKWDVISKLPQGDFEVELDVTKYLQSSEEES